MQIIPAIDLKNQQSVRLYQGDFQQTTVISKSPLQQALAIDSAGSKNLHLVDLDGAKSGRPVNRSLIEQICAQTDLKVEVGGGIRSLSQINTYLTSGVNRVILGSAALNNPSWCSRPSNNLVPIKSLSALTAKMVGWPFRVGWNKVPWKWVN